MTHRPDAGPMDLDLEPTGHDELVVVEGEPCAEPGCEIPVSRYGGQWWHNNRPGRAATDHRPRPVPHPVIDADLMSGVAPVGGQAPTPRGGPGTGASPGPGPSPQTDDGTAVPFTPPEGVADLDPRSPVPSSPAYEFRLTFPIRFERDPHPAGLWVHPDGWVTVIAPSYIEARRICMDLFGPAWSDLITLTNFDAAYYPRGELLRITLPRGVVEMEDHR